MIVFQPSPNHDARDRAPTYVVLHYTDMPDCQLAADLLCDPAAKVSAHYLIGRDGKVIQLVDEVRRAWHAGVSYWRGERDMNAASIGIELDHEGGSSDFPDVQMNALYELLDSIVTRQKIDARNVIGHSDIAPGRKLDPGAAFDWAALHRAGFGVWLEDIAIENLPTLREGSTDDGVVAVQKALAQFGFEIAADGIYGAQTAKMVAAFQLHFRTAQVDGVADAETQSLIYAYCQT